jgi:hypothetical protein
MIKSFASPESTIDSTCCSLLIPGLSRNDNALRARKLTRFQQDGEGTGTRTSRPDKRFSDVLS